MWIDTILTVVGYAFVSRSSKRVCNLCAIGNVSDWLDVTLRSVVICQCIRSAVSHIGIHIEMLTWHTPVWNVSSQCCHVHNTTFVPWWASKLQWKGFHCTVFICQYEQILAISERVNTDMKGRFLLHWRYRRLVWMSSVMILHNWTDFLRSQDPFSTAVPRFLWNPKNHCRLSRSFSFVSSASSLRFLTLFP
jgi:hypothetical protein